ncbi:hypothetical protein [Vreelandella massiliensis]|uniref:hypothetical protein n=1 Tax=Vreelandella massiliensis TaxID=1816686 RepID=UPI00096A40F7|nr:hypothetical protein [Halomonas massiliensis]
MMTIPHFYFGLPAFLQGFLMVAVLCVVSYALIRAYNRHANAIDKAATKAEEKAKGATPASPQTVTQATPKPEPQPQACPSLSDDELAIYDIPTILRRQSDFTHRKAPRELMKPVTERLFRQSADAFAKRLKTEAERLAQFNCDFTDHLGRDVARLLGNENVVADGRFYRK